MASSSVFDFFTSSTNEPDPVVPANAKDELYALCDDPMTGPVKLISENLQFAESDAIRGCFIENSGFLVVGIVGLQVRVEFLPHPPPR